MGKRLTLIALAATLVAGCGHDECLKNGSDACYIDTLPGGGSGNGGGSGSNGGSGSDLRLYGVFDTERSQTNGTSHRATMLASGSRWLVADPSAGTVDELAPASANAFLLPILGATLPSGQTIDGGTIFSAEDSTSAGVRIEVQYADAGTWAFHPVVNAVQAGIAASDTAIAGNYTGSLAGAGTVSLAIQNGGAAGGTDAAGCAWEGTVSPDASAASLYRVRLGRVCSAGSADLDGYAYLQPASATQAETLRMVAGNSDGYVMGGLQRQ